MRSALPVVVACALFGCSTKDKPPATKDLSAKPANPAPVANTTDAATKPTKPEFRFAEGVHLALAPTGDRVLFMSLEKAGAVWDAKTGKTLKAVPASGEPPPYGRFAVGSKYLVSLAEIEAIDSDESFSPSWSPEEGSISCDIAGDGAVVCGSDYAEVNDLAYFGPGTIATEPPDEGRKPTWSIKSQQVSADRLRISSDGKTIVFVKNNEARVAVVDVKTKKLKTIKLPVKGDTDVMSMSPSGGKVALAYSSGTIAVVDVKKATLSRTIRLKVDEGFWPTITWGAGEAVCLVDGQQIVELQNDGSKKPVAKHDQVIDDAHLVDGRWRALVPGTDKGTYTVATLAPTNK